jgi:L-alanine-DL-glutamate epimerase-like enolase superfamily enzyme
MKITKVETLHCDAGWRPWTFIKINTDESITGYSECTDSHGSPRGISGVVKDLEPFLLGQDPRAYEKIYWDLYRSTRQSPGSIIQKAIGGIENALLDIKAKALGVSVCELFGGPIRDRIQVYWSHCGTSRARAAHFVGKKQIKTLDDVVEMGREVRERGFGALKTNIVLPGEEVPVYMPGFKTHWSPELNVSGALVKGVVQLMSAFREGAGPDVGLVIDLNFNFKTDGYIQIARALEPIHPLWVEIDSYDPRALLKIAQAIPVPIASCENLYASRQYLPYFELHAMDMAVIDIIWNGFAQSKKIADLAEIHEINVAPHNYQSHLSSFISAQFCAAVPNIKLLEVDVDDVPWKDEIVTAVPEIVDGYMKIPKGPGWGADIREEALKSHPWPK